MVSQTMILPLKLVFSASMKTIPKTTFAPGPRHSETVLLAASGPLPSIGQNIGPVTCLLYGTSLFTPKTVYICS